MEHLVNLRRLLYLIDTSMYENDVEKVKRVNFIKKALEARLDYGLTDIELILNHINGGIDFKVDFLDYNNLILDRNNVQYCHRIVEELLKYSFFYNEANNIQELLTEFKSADISNKKNIILKIEPMLDRIKNEFRKAHVEDNLNDVTFSLEDGTFEKNFITVGFRKGVELDNFTKIKIKLLTAKLKIMNLHSCIVFFAIFVM